MKYTFNSGYPDTPLNQHRAMVSWSVLRFWSFYVTLLIVFCDW